MISEKTEKDRLLKYMRVPAKKKPEWLYKMIEFTEKFSTKKSKKIRLKLRQS